MQDKYYADRRDLIKWSVLIRVAEQQKVSRIIQIAYLRPSTFGMIDVAGQQWELPGEVLAHFRNIRNVTALRTEIPISVFDRMFDDRATYRKAATEYLAKFGSELRLVFLDPDIGLEPVRKPDLRHVLNGEAHEIWSQLKTSEVFAFYQHLTNRTGRPWIEEKRAQLEKAIGLGKGAVLVGQSPSIANDVVIYFAIKS
jgi:hypothetical protein